MVNARGHNVKLYRSISLPVSPGNLLGVEEARTLLSRAVPALPITSSLGRAVCDQARNPEGGHHAALVQQCSSHMRPFPSKSFRNDAWHDQFRPQCRSVSQVLSSQFLSERSQHRKSPGKVSRLLIRIDSVSTNRPTVQRPGAFRRLLSNLTTAEASGSRCGHNVRFGKPGRSEGVWQRRGSSVRLLLAVGCLLSMFVLTSAFFVRRSSGVPARDITELVPASGGLPRNFVDNQTSGNAADGTPNAIGASAFEQRVHVSSPLHAGVTRFLVASVTNITKISTY